jgi:hypothetical protein
MIAGLSLTAISDKVAFVKSGPIAYLFAKVLVSKLRCVIAFLTHKGASSLLAQQNGRLVVRVDPEYSIATHISFRNEQHRK